MKAIFLDRDGVINYDKGYVYKIEDLIILNNVKEGLNIFKKLGFLLIVITNQSGIAKGFYTENDFNIFNKEIQKRIGINFDGIYFCPHNNQNNCECRKPKILNIEKSVEKYNLNLEKCYFIGDKDSDLETGKNAGIKTVLVKNNIYKNNIKADFEVKDLLEFAEILKSNIKKGL